jgi:hypothetical protein
MAKVRRKCKVCDHKQVAEINRRLRDGDSLNSISLRYNISRRTLTSHKSECLSKLLAQDETAKKVIVGDSIIKTIEEQITKVMKMIDACDDYLTDPDDPEKYFLGPQGHEIEVVYNLIDKETGKILPQKEKANIQDLLQEIEEKAGYVIKGYASKQTDPRELLLKALSKLEGTAKMIQESSKKLIEWEYQKKAMDEASSKGGSITVEEQVSNITRKVIIAIQGSDTENLSKKAGLPEL